MVQLSLFESEVQKLPLEKLMVFEGLDSKEQLEFEKAQVDALEVTREEIKDYFQIILKESKDVLMPSTKVAKKRSGLRVGVLFAGGPASGGHNVILGLHEALGDQNTLIGIELGFKGLLAGKVRVLSKEEIEERKNLGGFDLLGSDRKKIKTKEEFESVKKRVIEQALNALVVIGGDDSNTTAVHLASYLLPYGCVVIGVPKTIDGDLQVAPYLPISFGFDTACKIYSEFVGNILQDAASAKKYWHFVKVMGRTASHVALEIALNTRPSMTLISEEIAENQWRLDHVITDVVSVIKKRKDKGINHGVVVIPEGTIEALSECSELIKELNILLAKQKNATKSEQKEYIKSELKEPLLSLFLSFTEEIQEKLILDRDEHGNVQVSQIPTEKVIIEGVKQALQKEGLKISTQSHFLGYEGRAGAPSQFDANYTYNLGLLAGYLVLSEKTGYMAAISGIEKTSKAWAVPLVPLLHIETREGIQSMVLKKSIVSLNSKAFLQFKKERENWGDSDQFCSPGPRQLWGPAAKTIPKIVTLNQE